MNFWRGSLQGGHGTSEGVGGADWSLAGNYRTAFERNLKLYFFDRERGAWPQAGRSRSPDYERRRDATATVSGRQRMDPRAGSDEVRSSAFGRPAETNARPPKGGTPNSPSSSGLLKKWECHSVMRVLLPCRAIGPSARGSEFRLQAVRRQHAGPPKGGTPNAPPVPEFRTSLPKVRGSALVRTTEKTHEPSSIREGEGRAVRAKANPGLRESAFRNRSPS